MRKKKILVVDDERKLVEMVRLQLESEGYEVIVVNDGQDGLEKAKHERPNLIILDVMMPGMGGYEVCMKLKQTIETCDIPILMLSARGGDLDNQMGLDSGADAYLGKPYDSKNLLDKILELINKR